MDEQITAMPDKNPEKSPGKSSGKNKAPGTAEPVVDPVLQQQIDENLRLLYKECLKDDLSESLQLLVDRLRNGGKPS